MADRLVYVQMCSSRDRVVYLVRSDSQPNLTYEITGVFEAGKEPHCQCKSFQFAQRDEHGRLTCKHIRKVQEETCNYHEAIHGKPKQPGKCRFCGQPTVYVPVQI